MPKSETVYRIFVASPSDVNEERDKVSEVVDELNKGSLKNLPVRLESLKYETDVHPEAGSDPQNVINSQIGTDYDWLIGIFWHRIGAETPRARSGTVEEFEKALKEYRQDSSNLQFMIYFKAASIDPQDIDPEQFAEVMRLKERMSREGILYSEFKSLDDFAQKLRTDLMFHMSNVAKKKDLNAGKADEPTENLPAFSGSGRQGDESDIEDESGEQLGILDLQEVCESRMEYLENVVNMISEETNRLSEKISNVANQLNELDRATVPKSVVKSKINVAARHMRDYKEMIDDKVTDFRTTLRKTVDDLLNLVQLSVSEGVLNLEYDSGDDTERSVDDAREGIKELRTGLDKAYPQLKEFRAEVANLPRMTSELNKAKRLVTKSLDEMINEMEYGSNQLKYAENLLDQGRIEN